MNHRRPFAALVAAGLTLTGCGAPDQASTAAPPAATSAAPAPSAASGLGDSVKDAGDLPDPCTLLSQEQVVELTGRAVSRIDRDGPAGGDNRYCQWQQSGGQLAVFLARTTEQDFTIKIAEATPVNDVGERAFQLAGHLYVLHGTVSIDVYSRGDSDAENLAEAAAVAQVLIPKI